MNTYCRVTTEGGPLGHQEWWFKSVKEGIACADIVTQAAIHDRKTTSHDIEVKVERVIVNSEAYVSALEIINLSDVASAELIIFRKFDNDAVDAMRAVTSA